MCCAVTSVAVAFPRFGLNLVVRSCLTELWLYLSMKIKPWELRTGFDQGAEAPVFPGRDSGILSVWILGVLLP